MNPEHWRPRGQGSRAPSLNESGGEERRELLQLLREEGNRTSTALETIAKLANTVCQLSSPAVQHTVLQPAESQLNTPLPAAPSARPVESAAIAPRCQRPSIPPTDTQAYPLVVLSYQTEQEKFMHQLVAALDAAGIPSVDGTKTPPGHDWRRFYFPALSRAKVYVPILSQNWVLSRACEDEVPNSHSITMLLLFDVSINPLPSGDVRLG